MMIKSSKPKKQRKFFHNMPLHKRQKGLASTLSKALRKTLGIRTISIRKGDKVKVVRGTHRNFEAKISGVDHDKMKVFLEKLVVKRTDGTEKPLPIHASNLVVIDVDKSDARRAGKTKGIFGTEKKETVKDKKVKAEGKEEAKAKKVVKKEKKKVKKDGD